jgi:hypothetical protein
VLDTTLVAAIRVARGLDASTLYQFRVRSTDIGDNETVSNEYDFSTAALGSFHFVEQLTPRQVTLTPEPRSYPGLLSTRRRCCSTRGYNYRRTGKLWAHGD